MRFFSAAIAASSNKSLKQTAIPVCIFAELGNERYFLGLPSHYGGCLVQALGEEEIYVDIAASFKESQK